MDFTTIIYNILLTIITTGMPILITGLVFLIRQHFSVKQLETAKILADNGVLYSEQVAKQLGFNGTAKYNSALVSVKSLAQKYNIKMSDDQWNSLIESSVAIMKKGLNDVLTPVSPITETPAIIPQPIISDPAQPILSDVPMIPVVLEAPVTPIITEIPVTPIPPVITIIETAPITPISTIPFVPQTVIDALTEQITLIAQQTANTTITNITNKAIADAMAKATNTPVI